MYQQSCCNDKTRYGNAVADFLQSWPGRSESRRGDVGAAEVIHNCADDEVDGCHAALTDEERSTVQMRIAHLRHDREESWRAAESEDERSEG